MSNRHQLEQAIAIQQSLRGTIDDAILDATIAALRAQLDALTTATAAPEQRRAQATILFIDLAGHTNLIQGRDPEEIMEIVDRALQRLAEPIARHGGRIVRYQGDGYKAVFGLPTAQENDPDNAVLAGLDILATAEAVAAEIEAEHDMPGFQVRVGIDTGLVLTGGGTEGEDAVTGLPVNLAARLESAAEPGTVLISHHTYQHVRGVFDMIPLEPIQAKGFPEPVAVYRVLRRKPRAFRTRRRGVEGVETRMVGREAELAVLQALYRRAIDEAQLLTAVITGEAGLGKSRLLYEFENWLDLQPGFVQLFRGRARLETRHLPYSLLRDVFIFRCGIYDDDTPAIVRDKIVASFLQIMDDPAAEMKAHFVGHLLGYDFSAGSHVGPALGDPRQLRSQALFYLTDYFLAVAGDNPMLIMLEDLHWADDSSLDAVEALTLALRGRPVFLLGAARPAFYERRPGWLEERPNHRRIDLARLDAQESGRLVAEILQKADHVPPSLASLVTERAEGNPFYLEELLKMLIDDGVIVTDEPTWRVVADRLDAIDIPPTLTGVLQARLEGLPAGERAALQRASIVGRQFWDAAVHYIGNEPVDSADDALWQRLRRRELVFQQGDSAFEGARQYLFSHSLLRDVSYESVLRRRRRDYHRRAAEWLARAAGERVDEFADVIAAHYAQAGDATEEAAWQIRAGGQAAARYATSEALRAFSRALELLPPDDPRRFEVLLGRESLHHLRAERDAQAADLDELEALCEQGHAGDQCEVALRRATYHLALGDFAATLAAGEQADRLAAAAGDPARRSRAGTLLGMALRFQGEYAGARRQLEEALAQARAAGDQKIEADTLRQLGVTAEEQGDLTGQTIYFESALRLAQQVGDRWGERRALNSLGIIKQNRGDYAASRECFEQSLATARVIGDRQGENTVLGNLGVQAYLLGQYAESQSLFQQGLEIARDADDVVGVNIAMLNLAYIAFLLGDSERSLALFDEARRSIESIGDRPLLSYVENGAGRVLLETGRPAEAIPALRRALALREEFKQVHLAAESRMLLAEALAMTGSLDKALAATDEVLAFLETESFESAEDTLRGLLAAHRVLSAAGDERAGTVLARAYDMVMAAAAQLDEPFRRGYLENVPWNREIVALHAERV
jgi:class 3 adenylate cyclase/tetratricopeptide (TPR) repeat protein